MRQKKEKKNFSYAYVISVSKIVKWKKGKIGLDEAEIFYQKLKFEDESDQNFHLSAHWCRIIEIYF